MSAKKQKREPAGMPPEYVKGPGKPGYLHPHWRTSFPDDEEDADGRGKVVFLVPESLRWHGAWRRVPGFYRLLAAADGQVMTEGDWVVRKATVGSGHYLTVNCNGTTEKVHLLVCRAFKGRPTPDQVSVDHLGGNELPMAERRQDNRAVNLDWATLQQQARNRGDLKAHSHGEPCLVWEVKGRAGGSQQSAGYMTPAVGAARRFPSSTAAAKALGLGKGYLSHILNGKYKTAPGTDCTRYTGKWDPDLVDLEGEVWKEKPLSTRNRLFLSNYGRLQFIYPGGREGTKHYPESSDTEGYLRVKIDGKSKRIHVLVGELFYKGSYPPGWKVWDHLNLDKQDNRIANLRPVTREENGINTARQRDFYLWPVDDPDDWVRCVSQRATARAYGFEHAGLNAVLHKRLKQNGSIRKTVGGYCAVFCDEVE